MKKKIFAISDIHGDYKALIEGLKNSGFDENNEDHLLISLGDAFDRGSESLAVYEFLKKLSDNGKAIVLKGNHTNMFIEYLNGESLDPFNYIRNGEDETFAEFLHETKPFESWCLLNNIVEPTYGDFANWVKEARDQINNEFPELLQWLQDRPYYFETDNYIFTHASIDTFAKDWHNPHCFKYGYVDWDALMWDDGKFYGRPINNTDKTIVIGHFGTDHLRNIYGLKNNDEEDFSILRRDDGRIIAIDSTTAYTHKLNVLVIENEDLLSIEYV